MGMSLITGNQPLVLHVSWPIALINDSTLKDVFNAMMLAVDLSMSDCSMRFMIYNPSLHSCAAHVLCSLATCLQPKLLQHPASCTADCGQ